VTTKACQVSYLNPSARVLDLPDWLLEVRQVGTQVENPRWDDGSYVAA